MEAAFFDLDKTVISKPSMVAFGRPLYEAGMISRALLVKALWNNLVFQYFGTDAKRLTRVRKTGLRIIEGWDAALLNAIVQDTLPSVIEPIIFDEARELIAEHQQAGRRVFLISAAPEEIVVPVGALLGVDETIASRAELGPDGRYTGNAITFNHGPNKAVAMDDATTRHAIDLDASYAYSDSATDLPMLEVVGHPVAVNPDRALARIARERGWEIRHFTTSASRLRV